MTELQKLAALLDITETIPEGICEELTRRLAFGGTIEPLKDGRLRVTLPLEKPMSYYKDCRATLSGIEGAIKHLRRSRERYHEQSRHYIGYFMVAP